MKLQKKKVCYEPLHKLCFVLQKKFLKLGHRFLWILIRNRSFRKPRPPLLCSMVKRGVGRVGPAHREIKDFQEERSYDVHN